jgi:hypothetical protein
MFAYGGPVGNFASLGGFEPETTDFLHRTLGTDIEGQCYIQAKPRARRASMKVLRFKCLWYWTAMKYDEKRRKRFGAEGVPSYQAQTAMAIEVIASTISTHREPTVDPINVVEAATTLNMRNSAKKTTKVTMRAIQMMLFMSTY